MNTPAERPFFIVGVNRSGTTLLRYMLLSSPRIYIPPESDFIPRFFGRRPHGPLSRKQAVRILATIFGSYRLVREWQGEAPDLEAFVDSLPDLTPAALLDALYRRYAEQNGAVRWADKTPIYTRHIDLIAQIFPMAQFIHVIRDGRDVALSMVEKWGKEEFHIDIYFAARDWVRRIRRARASGARLGPGRYYEVRYENLVKDPEHELRAVCKFLDEPYLPQMAHPHLLARERIPIDDFHAPVRQPPTTNRVGRWQTEMSEADQRLFQHIAGGLLAELGYEVGDVGAMPLQEMVRFAGLGAKYAALQAGRCVLQAVGVFPPN
jgi:hypothetical protein